MSVDGTVRPAECAQEARRTAGTWVGMPERLDGRSGLVSNLAAEPLAALRELTACCCSAGHASTGVTGRPGHFAHCLAEYREDVEVLAALLDLASQTA